MSKFTLTVTDDHDYRIIIREHEDIPDTAEIVYQERKGSVGWVDKDCIPALYAGQIDTMINRLKITKQLMEEEE